ncbi:unnamed protein product [Peniophora sp. CBMAI 1063]|nr:unnamed protein product [Peniophora sp. CBMAI 1063]
MSYSRSTSYSSALARTRYLDAFQSIDASIPRIGPTDAQASSTMDRLEEEIIDIRLLLSAVNERRNELALVSMLPPEVMTHIVSFLRDIWPIYLGSAYRSGGRTLGWVTVTHVCRRMRNICLEQRWLWAHLSPDDGQPWKIFVERASGSPLVVKGLLDRESYAAERVRSIIQSQDQLQELSLDFAEYHQLQELAHGLTGPLPHLQVLRLFSTDYPATGLQESRASLYPQLLADAAPALRCLDVTGVIFPWGSGSASLTQFHYTSNVNGLPMRSMPLSLNDIISSLRLMPALMSFKLFDARPALSTIPIDAVRLPQLAELHINTLDNSCWHLWSLMDLPRLLHLRIRGEYSEGTAALTTPRLQLLYASHAPWSPSLHVGLGQEFVTFELTKDELPSFSDSQRGESHLSQHLPFISLEVSRGDIQSMARQFSDIIQADAITTIDVTVPERSDYWRAFEGFHEAFMPASSVTTLIFRQRTEFGLAALTRAESASDSPSRAGPSTFSDSDESRIMLFPRLRNLTCVSMNFTLVTDRAHPNIQTHSVMDRVLKARSKQAEGGIQQLTIQSCDVSSDWVKGWSEYVEDVQWDGEQGSAAAPTRRRRR